MFELFMNAQKKKATKKRAFTLVELVVVIVILGVLAGIAALSFSNMTQSSKDGVAKANLRAVKSGVTMYQAENEGKLPAALADVKKYLEDDTTTKPEGYTYTIGTDATGIDPAPTLSTGDILLKVTRDSDSKVIHHIVIKK